MGELVLGRMFFKFCCVSRTSYYAGWYKHEPSALLWSSFDLKRQL